MISTRLLTHKILSSIPFTPFFLLCVCFTVFLFRLALKRDWLACGALVMFASFYTSLTASWWSVILTAVSVSLMMLSLARFGFLGLVGYYSMLILIGPFLITTNLSAWYASSGLVVAGLVLAMAGYAFHTALGGQKVFAGKLLEE